MTLKHVKNSIHVTKFLKRVIEITRITSASSFKLYEKLLLYSKEYLDVVKDSMANIHSLYRDFTYNFYKSEKFSSNTLLLILGTDKSLCGSFNQRVVKKVMSNISSNSKLFCIGNKLYQTMSPNLKKKIIKNIPLLNEKEKMRIDRAFSLINQIYEILQKYNISICEIIYTEFHSMRRYEIRKIKLLPIETSTIKHKSKFPSFELDNNLDFFAEVIIKKYLNALMFNILCSSALSENASRMISMEAATKKSKDKLKELKLVYNKGRQNKITKELIEVVSGAEGVKK
jgi:F-type H+-transporting ATPase subunit gamma